MPRPAWHAFSNYYNGLSNRLITKATVTDAFNPADVSIDRTKIERFETDALWDTGATHSVITPEVVKELGLKPIGKIKVRHGGGESEEDRYIVNLVLPNGVLIAGVTATEMRQVVDHFGVIVGMDVISMGDFSVTNFAGKTCFSFRLPSQHVIDYVHQHRSMTGAGVVAGVPKIRPNDACSCGSGRKFKKCCGGQAR